MTEGKPPEVPAQAMAWLDARPEPPPAELRQRMAEALAGARSETVPGALAEGALACLQATVAAPQERATALDLLAADALLTYALEAAAEVGAAALREMTQALGPDAFAGLLPDPAAAPTPAGERADRGVAPAGGDPPVEPVDRAPGESGADDRKAAGDAGEGRA